MDRSWAKHRRGIIFSISLIVLILSLLLLWLCELFAGAVHMSVIVLLFSLQALSSTPPYSCMSLISLDLGGKRGTATISSLNDSIGYFGSVFSGLITGYLSSKPNGWSFIFLILTGFAVMTTVAMGLYYCLFEKKVSRKSYTLFRDQELDTVTT